MTGILTMLLAILGLSACSAGETSAAPVTPPPTQAVVSEQETPSPSGETASGEEETKLKITVGDEELLATFEDNPSAEEFRDLLAQGPVTVEMDDYGGFEKVGPLGTTLTRSDEQITTQPGDVILYQGNQITIYYGTNTWSFTRLARIDDPTDLRESWGMGRSRSPFLWNRRSFTWQSSRPRAVRPWGSLPPNSQN